MMADDIPRYDYSSIMAAADPAALIAALMSALGDGDIVAPQRAHHDFGNGVLLLMPAWRPGRMLAVKVATVIPGNAASNMPAVQGEVLLISAETGQVLASLDGAAVTQLRTAALAGLAIDRLAEHSARSVLVVGTGALAPHILLAARAVRPSSELTLWGRNSDKVREIAAGSGLDNLRPAFDLSEAVRIAEVIVCATGASEPLITAADLQPGALLILIGGFRPDMREAEPACFKDALVVVDGPDAITESGDLLCPIELGLLEPKNVASLETILTQSHLGRHKRTIFKSVGSARFDLVAAEQLYQALQSTDPTRQACPPKL